MSVRTRVAAATTNAVIVGLVAGVVAMTAYEVAADVFADNLRMHARRSVVERAAAMGGTTDAEAIAEAMRRQQTIASPAVLVVRGEDELTTGGFHVADLPRGLRVHTQAFGGAPTDGIADGARGGFLVVGSFLDDADTELYLAFPRADLLADLGRLRDALLLSVLVVAVMGAIAGLLRARGAGVRPSPVPSVVEADASVALPVGMG